MKRLLVMCVGISHLAARADSGPVLPSEADFFAEQPIVLSVSRLAQSVSDAPAAVTVIDRAMIEASGFRHVVDLLRLVPGFQVTWTQGNLPAVTYHGLASLQSRRMQVLVDGRSVYNPAYGQVLWRALPVTLNEIERIEVVRGPNAAIDGANAFQATIHIITRHAAAERGSVVQAGVGENAARDLIASLSKQVGDLSFRLSAQYRHDDLFDKNYYPRADETAEHILSMHADYRIDAQTEFTAKFGYTRGDWQNTTVAYDFNPKQQTTDLSSNYGQLRWHRVLDGENEWSAQFHHTRTRSDEVFRPPGILTSPDNLNAWFQRDALEINAIQRLNLHARMSWAAEARYDAAWSASLTDRNEVYSGWMYRLSAVLEWTPVPDWQAHAAAMLEKHYYAGTRLSPRLALIWHPAAGHSLRMAATRGYRSPNFLENNADFKSRIGSLIYDQLLLSPYKLDPERITTGELGYVLHLPRSQVDLDVRLFRNRLDDLIDFGTPYRVPGEIVGDGADLTFENNVHAEQDGLEYQLRWQTGRRTWVTLWQSFSHTSSNNPAYEKSVPSVSGGLLANHDFGQGMQASLGYYRVGKMSWLGANAPTPDHDRLDLRLAKRWRDGSADWEAALVVQSVLGTYSEYESALLFDRRAYVSLRAGF